MFSVYNIVLNRLAEWLIPTRLRTSVLLAIVKACYTPFINLHNDFLLYRKAKKYELAMNYQVCYLESFLNDRFDFTQRRIYIEDAKNHPAKYIHQLAELKPLVIFARSESNHEAIYTRGENLGDYANDFVIFIPVSVVFDEKEIRAMIATKLSGKRYKIETF
jgi:hypothetical protein